MIRYNPVLNELLPDDFGSAFRMNIFQPKIFKAYVDHYIILYNPESSSSNYLVLPDHSGYFVFYVLGNPSSPTYRFSCIGPRSRYIEINRKHRLTTLVIKFKPGGMFPFIPVPLNELADSSCLMHDFNPEATDRLREQIVKHSATNFRDCLDSFETFLLRCFDPNKSIHRSLQALLLQPDPFNKHNSVKSLANAMGVSERYLLALTTRQIGLNPKRLLMISRVLQSLTQADLSDAGYYDQAHMIDEYNELLGRTPGKLFKEFGKRIR